MTWPRRKIYVIPRLASIQFVRILELCDADSDPNRCFVPVLLNPELEAPFESNVK